MRRHVIISTLQRGRVHPPEPLDSDNQKMIHASIEIETMEAQHEPQASRWRTAMDAKADTYDRRPPARESMFGPAHNLLMTGMGRKPRY